MRHVLNISLALILIVASPSVSRPDPVDSIPYEELVGVWTFTQNGFDHNFAEDRVIELCKSIISVNYHDHHLAIHMRLKYLDLERGVNVLTMEPCTFVDNVLSCRVESEESKEGKRTLTLYEKVRKNVYDVSALKPDGKTVSKEQTIYACPIKITDVQKWIENDMESKFVTKKSRLVDGKWIWNGVLFERKVKGEWGWHAVGDEAKDHKYSGEIKKGQPDGHGIITYPDGRKYVGKFKDGRRHGQGTFTWSDGKKYVGQWKDNKKNGQGTETRSDGGRYIGEWKDGAWHGQGTIIFPDGDNYKGELKNGRLNGQGTYIWSDGQKYVGQWKDSKRDGQGTRTWPDGRKYQGEWKDGAWHGQGTFNFPDGRKFLGKFKLDKPWDVTGFDKNENIIGKWINGVKKK